MIFLETLTCPGYGRNRRAAGLCLGPGQLQDGRPRPLRTAVECQEKVETEPPYALVN